MARTPRGDDGSGLRSVLPGLMVAGIGILVAGAGGVNQSHGHRASALRWIAAAAGRA